MGDRCDRKASEAELSHPSMRFDYCLHVTTVMCHAITITAKKTATLGEDVKSVTSARLALFLSAVVVPSHASTVLYRKMMTRRI